MCIKTLRESPMKGRTGDFVRRHPVFTIRAVEALVICTVSVALSYWAGGYLAALVDRIL